MSRYKLHSLQIHADGMGSAVVVPDILSQELTSDATVLRELVAADISPKFAAIAAIKLAQSIESFAIDTILDTIGTQGLGVKSATNPGVSLFL
ncbi:hypothetical protein, partial [uncultured Maritalea sp.]|uniref:hypothetical protein n=1 Tax=uncultured Maritalea sp. TaxID=757249 RepID=UPI00261A16EF